MRVRLISKVLIIEHVCSTRIKLTEDSSWYEVHAGNELLCSDSKVRSCLISCLLRDG